MTRHAGTTLNAEGRVNGDPAVAVPLTDEGRAQAEALGLELANLPFDLCVHTRFERTRATAELALAGRDVPLLEEPLLDDIDVGELEGRTIAEYREWKAHNDRTVSFPGGESLDEAARRYAAGFRKLLALPASSVLVVTHEIPLRYALNAAAGSDDLDGPVHQLPNARPYLFEADALARAARQIDELVGRAS
jgi:2,3-bisphosphoglycerate-dependent phosphoglycerate mutase